MRTCVFQDFTCGSSCRSLISAAKDAEKKFETKRAASSAAPWTYTGKVKLDSSVCTWVSRCQCVCVCVCVWG